MDLIYISVPLLGLFCVTKLIVERFQGASLPIEPWVLYVAWFLLAKDFIQAFRRAWRNM